MNATAEMQWRSPSSDLLAFRRGGSDFGLPVEIFLLGSRIAQNSDIDLR